MNGRVYDPLLGMFLSPDPYIQESGNWLNYNRYSYCLNNPLMYTDPSGEVFQLVPLLIGMFSYIGTNAVISGIQAELGGTSFGEGFWKGAVSYGITSLLAPVGGSSLSFGGNMLISAYRGLFAGSLDALMWGKNWVKTVLPAIGADMLMTGITSSEFYNWGNGKGFKSNNSVLTDFAKGKYTSSGGKWQQDALDYFGFEGTYVEGRFDNDAWFGEKTGICYSNGAFSSYDNLRQSYTKESFEKHVYLTGKRKQPDFPTGIPDYDNWAEELNGHIYEYKNNGLYLSANPAPYTLIETVTNHMNNINLMYGTVYKNTNFKKKWWHFIYKIPRKY